MKWALRNARLNQDQIKGFCDIFGRTFVQTSYNLGLRFWKLSGWDAIGCLAGEIENPQKNMFRAALITLCLIVAQYVLVFAAASALPGADGKAPIWETTGDDEMDKDFRWRAENFCGTKMGIPEVLMRPKMGLHKNTRKSR